MKKNLMLTAAFVALLALIGGNISAQTKNDVAIAYNAALKLDSADHIGAAAKMLDVMGMCKTVGSDADELKRKASDVIQQIANNYAKEKKYNEAISVLDKSIAYCDKNNEQEIKQKLVKMLVKTYAFKGQDQLKADSTDAAIISFDKAIALDPTFTKAYYSKGLACKKKEDFANMQLSFDKTIELAGTEQDTATVSKAKEIMASTFQSRASKAMTAKKYPQAIEYANSALTYNNNKSNVYLILASSYNSTSKFDLAIEAANKGLAIEAKPEKQIDFYFQAGMAYQGKKDNINACTSYKKVTSGPNKAYAASQITTVLKCK